MSVEDTTEVPETTDLPDLSPLERDRFEWFGGLGFDAFQALELATARDSKRQLVTVHDVRKTLAAGCSHELAVEIFT